MRTRSSYRLDNPSDALVVHFSTALRSMHHWRDALKPTLDRAFDDLKADGHLSTSFADALDDFGRYCLTKAEEVRAERQRLGIATPKRLAQAKR